MKIDPFAKGASKKHHYVFVSEHVDVCQRCGNHYNRLTDGWHGAIYCNPTPQWLRDNPTDDREVR